MNPEFHLRLAGALQIALACLHLFFPKRFAWKEELRRLSALNRQMFLVHAFFLCLVMVLAGSLSLLAPGSLLEKTALSPLVLLGFSLFWSVRLLFQWAVYDPALWRGNRFNTMVHWLFTALWAYLASVYAGAWIWMRDAA